MLESDANRTQIQQRSYSQASNRRTAARAPRFCHVTPVERRTRDRGFEPGPLGTFSNGRATLRFQGTTLRATSIAAGGTTWNSDLRSATPDALRALLDVLLASEPFLSPAVIQRRAERNSAAAQALNCLAETIREDPHSPVSVHLRRLLWSLFNGNHALNLWRLRDVLDARHTGCVRQVLVAWIDGQLSPDALRDALMSSGEMDLWETVRLGAPHERRLADSIDAVTDLLNVIPPGAPTRELTDEFPAPQHHHHDRPSALLLLLHLGHR